MRTSPEAKAAEPSVEKPGRDRARSGSYFPGPTTSSVPMKICVFGSGLSADSVLIAPYRIGERYTLCAIDIFGPASAWMSSVWVLMGGEVM